MSVDVRVAAPDHPGRTPRPIRLLGRHGLFALVLLAGVALRVLAWLAYHPAILFLDSFRYLANLEELNVDGLNPIGYTLFLKPVLALGGMSGVTALQHLLGLAMGVAVYALALRCGARGWLAAIGAAPVLLDAYQVQIEQLIMTDLLFQVLLVALLWVCVSSRSPGLGRMALAGLLIGAALITRSVAITLLAPVLVYAVAVGAQWRRPGGWVAIGKRLAGLLGALAVVLAAHSLYAYQQTGSGTVTSQNGNVLYGRTAQLADCPKLHLDRYLSRMCPDEPVAERPGTDLLAHRDGSPTFPPEIPPGATKQSMMTDFGVAVIKAQPWDVAKAIGYDFVKGFAPQRVTLDKDPSVTRWQFQLDYPYWTHRYYVNGTLERFGGDPASVNPGLAAFLRDYQLGGGFVPGPVQALFLLLGVAGAAGLGRRAGLRSTIFLATAIPFTMLFSAAMFEFSWRYQLPGIPLLPLAGVLAITAFTGRRRRYFAAAGSSSADSAAA